MRNFRCTLTKFGSIEKSRPSVKKKSYKNINNNTIFYPESPVPLNLKFALDSTNFNQPYWAAAHSSVG